SDPITVTNTGDEALTNLVVNDPLLGGNLSGFGSTLAVGASVTKTFTHTITAGDPDPLTNTVTATASGHDSKATVTDTSSCETDVLHTPGISVEKTCPTSANIGDTITYSITVTNTGDEALTNLVVNDPVLGGNLSGFGSTLAVGASVTKTFTYTITASDPDPLTNTVTATATGADSGDTVEDSASCETDVLNPQIDLVKGGVDFAHVSDAIPYDFTVTNTGDTDLHDVKLVDPICNDGTITIVTQGDGDSTLAVDETWTYSC